MTHVKQAIAWIRANKLRFTLYLMAYAAHNALVLMVF